MFLIGFFDLIVVSVDLFYLRFVLIMSNDDDQLATNTLFCPNSLRALIYWRLMLDVKQTIRMFRYLEMKKEDSRRMSRDLRSFHAKTPNSGQESALVKRLAGRLAATMDGQPKSERTHEDAWVDVATRQHSNGTHRRVLTLARRA